MKIVIGKLIVFKDRMPKRLEEAIANALEGMNIEPAIGERDSHYLVIDNVHYKGWTALEEKPKEAEKSG